MAEIKLLALDLDGTLLNGEKQISPRTRAALDRVRQQGVLVVPVTGRPSQGIPQAVLDLPGLRYAVSSNGATIRDLATGQVLLEKLLPAATCLEVLDRCAQVPMLREVFRAGVGYLSRGDYETLRARYAGTSMLQYHLDTRQVLPGTVAEFLQADPRPVEELFFLTGSPQEKAALRDLLTGIQGIGFADPFPNDLEVIAGDIDKGEALRFLLRHLGLEASQVLAMGDGGSDLPLLQAAGIGVAMANAIPELRAAAAYVCRPNTEDGVARFVGRNAHGRHTGAVIHRIGQANHLSPRIEVVGEVARNVLDAHIVNASGPQNGFCRLGAGKAPHGAHFGKLCKCSAHLRLGPQSKQNGRHDQDQIVIIKKHEDRPFCYSKRSSLLYGCPLK